MPLDAWLTQARDAAARCAGLASSDVGIEDKDVALLLDLAGAAAHESGDRRNAPLLCYIVGRATQGATLEELAAAIHPPHALSPNDGNG